MSDLEYTIRIHYGVETELTQLGNHNDKSCFMPEMPSKQFGIYLFAVLCLLSGFQLNVEV